MFDSEPEAIGVVEFVFAAVDIEVEGFGDVFGTVGGETGPGGGGLGALELSFSVSCAVRLTQLKPPKSNMKKLLLYPVVSFPIKINSLKEMY